MGRGDRGEGIYTKKGLGVEVRVWDKGRRRAIG